MKTEERKVETFSVGYGGISPAIAFLALFPLIILGAMILITFVDKTSEATKKASAFVKSKMRR